GCYVDVKSLTHERFVNSPMLFLPYPPKRDSLLCVARHKAVTRTWDAPLSKALRPGFSVSGVEPSGVCFSWYCQPSSRSLGKLSSNRSSLKRTVLEQGSSRSFFLTKNDHWLPAGAGGNSSPSMSNNDLMRCFIRTISLTKVSRSWVRWRSSRYKGVGTWMPFELSATKVLRAPFAIEPIGLPSLSWGFGNHRRRSDQARVSLGLQPIIQCVARGSSLVGKRHLLIGIVLTNVVHKMFDLVRHVQRLKKSLV